MVETGVRFSLPALKYKNLSASRGVFVFREHYKKAAEDETSVLEKV